MPRIVDDIEQGTPEWLALRAGVVSASRFKDMMACGKGLTRNKLRNRLANEILTGKPGPPGFVNDAMRRGTELEPEARNLYEFITGHTVRQCAFVFSDNERIGCSPDGLVGSDGLVEIKCCNLELHIDYLLANKMPKSYLPQVQGQLWVTGRDWCDFVSYHPDACQPLLVVRVDADSDYHKTLADAADAFLADLDGVVQTLKTRAA